MAQIRLDKLICQCGGLSRSEARTAIKSGRVWVNGVACIQQDMKLDPMGASVCLDGKKLRDSGFIYLMLNKPAGFLSATEDASQQTVLELLPQEFATAGLFPVGRLDKDTTGLMLLTNDGDFCHAVTSPKRHVVKVYEAFVDGELNETDVKEFEKGVMLRDGTKCLPAVLRIDSKNLQRCFVEIEEGKYHQVKRMLASRNKPVISLKRISIGGLMLDENLAEGKCREIDQKEKRSVFETKISNSNNM